MQLLPMSTSAPAFTAAQPPASAASAASVSSSSTNSSTGSASISANDFLQLLVTEMKNQDPTTQTDPNQYIDQLVQVNSLEQLIQINQDLGSSSSSASSASGGSSGSASVSQPVTGGEAAPASPAPVAVSGNLSVPQSTDVTSRVSRAMTAASHADSPGTLPDLGADSFYSPLRMAGRNTPTRSNQLSNPAR